MRHVLFAVILAAGAINVNARELDWADAVAAFLKQGELEQALKIIDAARESVQPEADTLLKACRAAASIARSRASTDLDAWDDVARTLIEWTEKETASGDTTIQHAHAEALLCSARIKAAQGAAETKDWTTPADELVGLHKTAPGDGSLLLRAIEILQEGSRATGSDANALSARAYELCERGATQHKQNKFFKKLLNDQTLARVRTLLKDDRRTAKKLLSAHLEKLSAEVKGLKKPDILDATAFNDAVMLARQEKKLGVKAKFLVDEVKSRNNVLLVDIPVSKRWKWSRGADLGIVKQLAEDGKTVVRSINFYTYDWDTNYESEGRMFGGDNIKGLARLGEADAKSYIVDIKKKSSLRRMKLNSRIPHSVGFMYEGLDKDGDFVRLRYYYFKAKKTRMLTVFVLIFDFTDVAWEPDAQWVLKSIREPKKKNK